MPADDPKMLLTKWLTMWGKEAGTRLQSKEQLEFIDAYSFAGSEKGLNIPFYQEIVDIDNRAMMALKGKRSDDVVEALSRISDSEMRGDFGVQPAHDYIRNKNRRDTSNGD